MPLEKLRVQDTILIQDLHKKENIIITQFLKKSLE